MYREERTQIKQTNLTAVEKSSLTRCYSCGSLFSAESSDCESFDPSDKNQVVTCKQGEACLFYAWRVSKKETGQELHIYLCQNCPFIRIYIYIYIFFMIAAIIRECFPTSALWVYT